MFIVYVSCAPEKWKKYFLIILLLKTICYNNGKQHFIRDKILHCDHYNVTHRQFINLFFPLLTEKKVLIIFENYFFKMHHMQVLNLVLNQKIFSTQQTFLNSEVGLKCKCNFFLGSKKTSFMPAIYSFTHVATILFCLIS